MFRSPIAADQAALRFVKAKVAAKFRRWDISNAGAAYTKEYVLGKDLMPSRCRDAD
jgi:hypothetical protein